MTKAILACVILLIISALAANAVDYAGDEVIFITLPSDSVTTYIITEPEYTIEDTELIAAETVTRIASRSHTASFQKGFAYTSWWNNDYQQSTSDTSLGYLEQTGTEWVSLLVTWYQDTGSSTTISSDGSKTPTDASIAEAINDIHNLGMNVMLKPHVDAWDGTSRTDFVPSDYDAWFASYADFINHYAELAETYGVEQFAVGTELKQTTSRQTDWENIISGVRSRYSGDIIYAANHDNYDNINWWGSVDYIGVDAYFPLTSKTNPTLQELKDAWTTHKNSLSSFYSTWGKPIIFTEIGYQSRDGTNIQPWGSEGSYDEGEQEDAYRAAFESLWDESWLHGMYWWHWYYDVSKDYDDFAVYGKSAKQVVEDYYTQQAQSNTAPTISGIPDKSIKKGTLMNQDLVYLPDYASDAETASTDLNYTITGESDIGTVDCSIDENNYLDCEAQGSWTGSSTVTIEVSDGEFTSTDSLIVSVSNDNNKWWWTLDNSGSFADMDVYYNGNYQGQWKRVDFGHEATDASGWPTVAAVYSSGFIRLKPAISSIDYFGTSFVLGPAYWPGASEYYHNPTITSIYIDADLTTGDIDMMLTGTLGNFSVQYNLTFKQPYDDVMEADVVQFYEAENSITIDSSRQSDDQGFKLVQFSSMYIDTTYHDSDSAMYQQVDGTYEYAEYSSVGGDSLIYTSPANLGSNGTVYAIHSDDSGWQGNTPNAEIQLISGVTFTDNGVQGYITATTDPNDDNVALWINNPVSSFSSGESNTITYTLRTKDNFAEPVVAECYSDSDCGTDGYTNSDYCLSGDVYNDYREWICSSPGAADASCMYFDTSPLQQECDYGCTDGVCDGAPGCVTPTDGIVITEDTTLCEGTYNMDNGITISADSITLDCNNALIQGSNSGVGITVTSSSDMIKNCKIDDYSYGIELHGNFHNVLDNTLTGNNYSIHAVGDSSGYGGHTIIGNTVLESGVYGIYVNESDDSTVENNMFTGGSIGVQMYNADSNVFTGNTIDGPANYGAHMWWYSTSNEFVNNTILNTRYGISFNFNSDDNLFQANTIMNNDYAGFFQAGSHYGPVSNNQIIGNYIENNTQFGINVGDGTNTIIKDNTVIDHVYAIGLGDSSGVTVYNNNFIDYTNPAYQYGTNSWDNGTSGNYWDSYDSEAEGCVDSDEDTVCDSAFIVGDYSIQDNYPYVQEDGWLSTNNAPTITSSPDTSATVDSVYSYDVDADDLDGDTLTYSLTQSPEGMSIDNSTGEIDWTPGEEGDYDIIVRVEDASGASDTQTFTITVDVVVVTVGDVVCYSDSECGTDGYTGSMLCSGSDIYQNYTTYTCNNAGTGISSCSSSVSSEPKQTCTIGCTDGVCDGEPACYSNSDCGTSGYSGGNYCSNDDVYRDYASYACNSAGTSSAYCSSATSATLIEGCFVGCSNGACIEETNTAPTAEITSPSDGDSVSSIITVTGTATDPDGDSELSSGEWSGIWMSFDYSGDINSATWYLATGTTSWSYELDTTTYDNGDLTITISPYDGTNYSLTSVVVSVDNQRTTLWWDSQSTDAYSGDAYCSDLGLLGPGTNNECSASQCVGCQEDPVCIDGGFLPGLDNYLCSAGKWDDCDEGDAGDIRDEFTCTSCMAWSDTAVSLSGTVEDYNGKTVLNLDDESFSKFLYRWILERNTDDVAWLVDLLEAGGSRTDAISYFFTSTEYETLYPGNAEFVDSVFEKILMVEHSADSDDWWLQQLDLGLANGGKDRGTVVRDLLWFVDNEGYVPLGYYVLDASYSDGVGQTVSLSGYQVEQDREIKFCE